MPHVSFGIGVELLAHASIELSFSLIFHREYNFYIKNKFMTDTSLICSNGQLAIECYQGVKYEFEVSPLQFTILTWPFEYDITEYKDAGDIIKTGPTQGMLCNTCVNLFQWFSKFLDFFGSYSCALPSTPGVQYCSGKKLLNSSSGLIQDKNSSSLYVAGTSCEWELAPLNFSSLYKGVLLTIQDIDIADGDVLDLMVYDSQVNGSVSNRVSLVDSVKGQSYFYESPLLDLFFSTNDDAYTGYGFNASYTSISQGNCSVPSTNRFSSQSGFMADGSKSSNRLDGLDCTFRQEYGWRSQFDLYLQLSGDAYQDQLVIYSISDIQGTLVSQYDSWSSYRYIYTCSIANVQQSLSFSGFGFVIEYTTGTSSGNFDGFKVEYRHQNASFYKYIGPNLEISDTILGSWQGVTKKYNNIYGAVKPSGSTCYRYEITLNSISGDTDLYIYNGQSSTIVGSSNSTGSGGIEKVIFNSTALSWSYLNISVRSNSCIPVTGYSTTLQCSYKLNVTARFYPVIGISTSQILYQGESHFYDIVASGNQSANLVCVNGIHGYDYDLSTVFYPSNSTVFDKVPVYLDGAVDLASSRYGSDCILHGELNGVSIGGGRLSSGKKWTVGVYAYSSYDYYTSDYNFTVFDIYGMA
jgi:hypothetical protein